MSEHEPFGFEDAFGHDSHDAGFEHETGDSGFSHDDALLSDHDTPPLTDDDHWQHEPADDHPYEHVDDTHELPDSLEEHVAEKNHLKLWVGETLTEARATMEAEVASQFIDAEHSLTLALDAALQRRIDTLDSEIKEIDEALRLDAQEKDKRRKELIAQQNVVRQVVGQIDQLLPALRTGQTDQTRAAAIAAAVTGGTSR